MGRGLGVHVARVAVAVAAVGAARAALERLRGDRRGRAKRVKAEPLAGIRKALIGRALAQRRHGIIPCPRRFPKIIAGPAPIDDVATAAGNTQIPFDTIVIGLEIVIADGPIDQRVVLRQGFLAEPLFDDAAHLELGIPESPARAAPVNGAAARPQRRRQVKRVGGAERAVDPRQESRLVAAAFAPGHRVGAHVGHDGAPRVVPDLVELQPEVVVGIMRAFVHADDPDPALCQFRGHDGAGRSCADDDHVDFAVLRHDHA